MIDKPGQVFSRIHVDDIAGSVLFLINLYFQGKTPSIVNVADNLPANNLDVINFAAKIAKKSLPSRVPFEIAQKTMSPMAISFWQENRKVDNKLLCKKLGYSLIYPDFKSGNTDPDLLKNMESEENFQFLNLSSSSALAALHGLVADNCILARRQFVFGQICTIYVSADLHAVSLHVHRTISTQRYII